MEMLKRSNFVQSGAQTIQADIMTVWEALDSWGWKNVGVTLDGWLSHVYQNRFHIILEVNRPVKGLVLEVRQITFTSWITITVTQPSTQVQTIDELFMLDHATCYRESFPRARCYPSACKNNSTLHHNEAWQGVSLIILFLCAHSYA